MDHLINRRHTLVSAICGAVALSGCATTRPATTGGLFARARRPIGVQLYTVADAARTDLDGTLSRLKAIGFETVELASYHGHTPRQLRDAADRQGLRYPSIHLQGKARGNEPALDGDLPRIAADLRVLGVENVVMPFLRLPAGGPRPGEDFRGYFTRVTAAFDAAYWRGEAAFLDRVGAALRREGLRFGYHNHNPEFAPVGDTNGFEILVANTDPANVMIELDVGWVAAAGHDPIELMRRHGDRVRLMHVKDIKASTRPNFTLAQDPTQVGDGTIDWRRLLPIAMKAGVTGFFVEQEPPFTIDRFDALKRSFDYLRTL